MDTDRPRARTRTGRAGRTAQLAGVATGQAAKQLSTRAANAFRPEDAAAAAIEARNIEMAERLLVVLGTMKGAALKFGQMLSMIDGGLIPDSHRAEFQTKLAALQDSAPKVPWDRMRRQIEGELHGRLTSHFRDFDETPVAAASIGQVYRAVLHDGREVAVKVQYPRIDTAVRSDLKNLSLFLKVYGRLFQENLDVRGLALELETRITEELDYVLEADNTRLVARAYRDHPFIRVPGVVADLSSERVLTTDWIEGRPLSGLAEADLDERNQVAEILYRFYAATPHRFGVFSGDPHPGNALALPDGTVAFLDFGLLNHISAASAESERVTIRATVEGDLERLMAVSQERGFILHPEATDPAELLAAMRTVGWWYCEDMAVEITADAVNTAAAQFAGPRSQFGEMATQHNLPPQYAFRARAEAQLVGTLSLLRPRINLHRVAREWLYDEPAATELGRQDEDWALGVGRALRA